MVLSQGNDLNNFKNISHAVPSLVWFQHDDEDDHGDYDGGGGGDDGL